MRLTSETWVKAYLRTAASHALSATVVRHGDDRAGAIFVKVLLADRRAQLIGPAPTRMDEAEGGAHQFIYRLKGAPLPETEIDAALEKETRFDPDIWIVEIESRDGVHHMESWFAATPL